MRAPTWYTPREWIDMAKTVMGAIDLAPAMPVATQRNVGAKLIFMFDDDRLSRPWEGRVFLNPPHAAIGVKEFVFKLVEEVRAGHVTEAILLTTTATETRWWQAAAHGSRRVFHPDKRIKFLRDIEGELVRQSNPTHGQTFFYFRADANCEKFDDAVFDKGVLGIPGRRS